MYRLICFFIILISIFSVGQDPFVPAPVPKTGQTTSYLPGDDGDLQIGVAWPNPRFTDNGDGTATDNLTGLIWLKNASCSDYKMWFQALSYCNSLASGQCGLTDGSSAGDWRLPNVQELLSLIDYGYFTPALSNAIGTGQWTEGDPFTEVQSSDYWSSTSLASTININFSWDVGLFEGDGYFTPKSFGHYVWPVRGGHVPAGFYEALPNWWESLDVLDLILLSLVPAPVPKTGQTTLYLPGDDGDVQIGVARPNPRFTNNSVGTVTDNLTGLIWLNNANCSGTKTWAEALTHCNSMASGQCGLTDGSSAGDWRLPNVQEILSLIDYGYTNPVLSNAVGTGQWAEGDPFTGVQSTSYWSSTSMARSIINKSWRVILYDGNISVVDKSYEYYVWPVRDGD